VEFLDFRDLVKSYGTVRAIDCISFTVKRGELVTLLGPSGSGKTSLLMTVAGFLEPDGGDILFEGASLLNRPPNKRNLGVVFQQYALFPHMNVRANVAYPLVARGIAAPERLARVTEALELVRLGDLGNRLPRDLSGGQQQRVALARALVFRPPILLMDEPLSALDRQLRLEMQLEIRAIQKGLGITTLYVTHDQEEALTISDRIAVMRAGRLVQIGTPEEIFERPSDSFVASFMGSANLIFAHVVRDAGSKVIVRTADGLSFPAESHRPRAPGEQVTIAVRPERIRLKTFGEGPGVSLATVENAVYLGTSVRLILRLGGCRLIALTQPDGIGRSLRSGSEIGVDLADSSPLVLSRLEENGIEPAA
jgi:putative spermidine/putrescine transport system ATP-binding protein